MAFYGDEAAAVLANSSGGVLLSDVYSGYGKSIRLANEIRTKKIVPCAPLGL